MQAIDWREFVVRRAVANDAAELARLSGQLGYAATACEIAGRLEDLQRSLDNDVLVACAPDGTLVGWIDLALTWHLQSGKSAEIGGLVVAEGWRSQGIGRLLVREAEKWARERGLNKIRVRSNVKRTDAHRFYEREKYLLQKTSAVFEKVLD
jgi:GNAT superfamily N-acetyltransferase